MHSSIGYLTRSVPCKWSDQLQLVAKLGLNDSTCVPAVVVTVPSSADLGVPSSAELGVPHRGFIFNYLDQDFRLLAAQLEAGSLMEQGKY